LARRTLNPHTYHPHRLPLWAGVTLVLIFGLAIIFRLSDLSARNLWTDEAWVALAALKPTVSQALDVGPPGGSQSTPPLYILSVWAMAKVFGGGEAALRLVSFLFGVGTLFFFWRLIRPLVSVPVALLALAALGFSPVMVYYSKELKQYSGDAFFAVLICFLAERLLRGRGGGTGGPGGWAVLALAGVLGLGFSHPLVFALPAVVSVLWAALPRRRNRVALLGLVWALAFAVYYLLFFRHRFDPELVAYWSQDFPDFSGALAFVSWVSQALYRYFWYFLGEWGVYWGPPLVAAGCGALLNRRRGRILVYFLGPMLLALGAAALHRYPFMAHYGGNRLMLFTAPLLYLTAAAGAGAILSWLWRQKPLKALALGLSVLVLASLHPVANFRENLHPIANREEIQPLVSVLESQLQAGDLVYLHYFAIQPFGYYYRGPVPRLCLGQSCVETNLEAAMGEGAPRRVWLLASHVLGVEHMRHFAAKLLGTKWQETACFTREGAVLFRFERREALAGSPAEPLQSGSPTPPPGKAY
jgi:4-amino-4-deoxy-L-arabinose transferase-like glycosyltransferase